MAFLSYTAKLAVVGASGEWEGRVTLPPSLLMAPRWSKMSYCFLQFSVFRFRFESPQVKRNLIFICKKNFVYEWPGKLPNDGRVSSKMLLNQEIGKSQNREQSQLAPNPTPETNDKQQRPKITRKQSSKALVAHFSISPDWDPHPRQTLSTTPLTPTPRIARTRPPYAPAIALEHCLELQRNTSYKSGVALSRI